MILGDGTFTLQMQGNAQEDKSKYAKIIRRETSFWVFEEIVKLLAQSYLTSGFLPSKL